MEMPHPASGVTIQFLDDWRHVLDGDIQRGGRLTLAYDKGRLPHCFTTFRGATVGNIVAYIRFHPRGEIVSGAVVDKIRAGVGGGMVVDHRSVAFEVPVPSDATRAEIWFHSFYQTTSRCDAWDSRFGDNYWFDIGGAPPRVPAQSVSYRTGAVTREDMVNVLEQSAVKVNVFPAGPSGRQGTDLQTLLKVTAWVNETYGANTWIDVHVFNDHDELIHAETMTLLPDSRYGRVRYEFSGTVYQGSTATPGSVQPRPDARKVQYRLYCEMNDQVFTDGILHQHDLQEDAVTR